MSVFPSKNEKDITLVIIIFVMGLILGLIADIKSDLILKGGITLLTVFSGAYFAFKLNDRKQLRTQVEVNVQAGNKAIFNLIKIYNSFGGFRNQFIEPHRDHPLRYIGIRPSIGFEGWTEPFDFDSLMYLIQSKDANVLNELSDIQSEIESTIELLKQRNDIHINSVQPKMNNAGIENEMEVTVTEVEKILGSYVLVVTTQLTDDLIDLTDDIIKRTEELIESMHALNSDMYNGYNILNMKKVRSRKI